MSDKAVSCRTSFCWHYLSTRNAGKKLLCWTKCPTKQLLVGKNCFVGHSNVRQGCPTKQFLVVSQNPAKCPTKHIIVDKICFVGQKCRQRKGAVNKKLLCRTKCPAECSTKCSVKYPETCPAQACKVLRRCSTTNGFNHKKHALLDHKPVRKHTTLFIGNMPCRTNCSTRHFSASTLF